MDEDLEIWKPVIDFEGYYEISSFGRVRTLSRLVTHSTGSKKYVRKGKLLKTFVNKKGYLRLVLHKGTLNKNKFVHQLVAEAFLTKSDNQTEVNHLDFDPLNNRSSNLEWTTHAENNEYSLKAGRLVNFCGKKQSRIWNVDTVEKIKSAKNNGSTIQSISENFGIGIGTVYEVLNSLI